MPGLSVYPTCKISYAKFTYIFLGLSVYLNMSELVAAKTVIVPCWVCLNHCNNALRLYWISEPISLTSLSDLVAEFFLILAYHSLISFSIGQTELDWISLNQCLPALSMYWISVSISLAGSVGLNDWIFLNPNIFFLIS